MKYDKAHELAQLQTSADDRLIGVFKAGYIPSLMWMLVLGPLFFIGSRQYVITVTEDHIHFNCLNILGHLVDATDKFSYEEVVHISATFKKKRPTKLLFLLPNNRKITLIADSTPLKRVKPHEDESDQDLFLNKKIAEHLKIKGMKC